MLKNIYSIGGSLLLNSQSAISVHSQNVANASTPGYRRRTVEMGANPYLQLGGHELGTGVEIERLRRHFDNYIARQQEQKNGENAMWTAIKGNLSTMDMLFKDSATKGLTKAMTDFWNQWQTLSENPGKDSARTGLLGKTSTLVNLLQSKRADMDRQVELMNTSITQETARLNKLMKQLAEINRQIIETDSAGSMLDSRDKIIEEMSGIVSIKSIIRENGQATVSLVGGQTLVDGASSFTVKFEGPSTENHLSRNSPFEDALFYKGKGKSQYTIECLSGGPADGSAGSSTFRVSIDGGKTWMTNSDGSQKVFTANGPTNEIKIGDVSVWFAKKGDSTQAATTNLAMGDRFVIKPQKNVFWYKNSSTQEDISPYDGNEKALSGGSLAGLLKARDEHITKYGQKLDSFANSLIWEVNYAHSQGAASTKLTSTIGSYKAEKTDRPIDQSRLPFANRINKGNFSLAIYNSSTGKHLATKPVDFSSVTPGVSAFDPSVHTLENVRDAINSTYSGQVSATINNGKLSLKSESGHSFAFAGDSSGLLAGLGLNTYFHGSSCSDMEVNSSVAKNISQINAGHVNGAGEVNAGDNTIARKLAELSDKRASFFLESGSSSSNFQSFISDLVSQVGSDNATAESSAVATKVQIKFLNDRQQEISGVNVKEEMVKLKQYQQHFQTASQLIKVANEMYDTLLSMR